MLLNNKQLKFSINYNPVLYLFKCSWYYQSSLLLQYSNYPTEGWIKIILWKLKEWDELLWCGVKLYSKLPATKNTLTSSESKNYFRNLTPPTNTVYSGEWEKKPIPTHHHYHQTVSVLLRRSDHPTTATVPNPYWGGGAHPGGWAGGEPDTVSSSKVESPWCRAQAWDDQSKPIPTSPQNKVLGSHLQNAEGPSWGGWSSEQFRRKHSWQTTTLWGRRAEEHNDAQEQG